MYNKEVMDIVFESAGIYNTNDIEYVNEANIHPNIINDYIFQIINNQTDLLEYNNILNEANNIINDKLDKIGIKSSNKISKEINITAKNTVKIIKNDGINIKSKDKIYNEFNKLHDKLSEFIREDIIQLDAETLEELRKKKLDNPQKIKYALSLLIMVIVANSLANLILSILLGYPMGNFILANIIGPINEEQAKYQALKNGCAAEFTLFFNMYEFTEYTIAYGPLYGFKKMMKLRLIPIGMHLTTTFIQWASMNEKVLKFLKIDPKDENAKEKISFIGNLLGIVTHSLYNWRITPIIQSKYL